MHSRPFLLQCRLTQDTERVQGQSTGARSESGFVHRRHYDCCTTETPPQEEAIVKVTKWLQQRLEVEGISLNHRKLQALLADGVGS